MPALPNLQKQIWITMPQALRWIRDNEEPSLENRESLPSFPIGDSSRRDLYHFWIDGKLKLFGMYGYEPRRKWTPILSSLPYAYDCWEHTDFIWIKPAQIKQAGFDSIEWEGNSLGRFELNKDEDETHPYFVDLRIKWASLRELVPPRTVRRSANATRGRRGRKSRSDWPLLAALAAIVDEHEANFKELSGVGKLEALKSLPKADLHVCHGNNNKWPSGSSFKDVALKALEDAKKFLKEYRPPGSLSRAPLPLVAALVAASWRHPNDDGVCECEKTMPKQLAKLLGEPFSLVMDGSLNLTRANFYETAVQAAELASKINIEFCPAASRP